MLLFRSLSIGLMAACFLLQIDRTQLAAPPAPPPPAPAIPPRPLPAATIIDVSGAVAAAQRSSLVRLESDEHVTAVDDRAVGSDLEAGAAITEHRGTGFIDLTVESTTSTRRVLMLLH
jgi:hypothetical protein